MIKLWLDDLRPLPDSSWLFAKTANEAIKYLKNNDVDFASLDHDLAPGHYPWEAGTPYPENSILVYRTGVLTGLNVVLWMKENNVWPKEGVRVHSGNNIGSLRMLKPIHEHYGKDFQKLSTQEWIRLSCPPLIGAIGGRVD